MSSIKIIIIIIIVKTLYNIFTIILFTTNYSAFFINLTFSRINEMALRAL